MSEALTGGYGGGKQFAFKTFNLAHDTQSFNLDISDLGFNIKSFFILGWPVSNGYGFYYKRNSDGTESHYFEGSGAVTWKIELTVSGGIATFTWYTWNQMFGIYQIGNFSCAAGLQIFLFSD